MTRSPLPGARRATVSAVALLALASLAGCGGSDDAAPSDDPTTISSVSETPSDEPSDTPSVDPSTPPDTGGEEITAQDFIDVYSASLDQATTAAITMTVEGPTPSSIAGQIDFGTQPPAVRMTITSDDATGPQEVLVVDGEVYVQLAAGRYYRTDAADSTFGGGAGGSGLDPRALLAQLADSIVSATAYGQEDVDGEVLDHYGVVLDAAALAADAPAEGLPDQLAVDVYVDSAGLLRRVTIDLGAAAGRVDVRYDSWGEPVDITAPKPSQVEQLPSAGSSPR